jgi:hypothetical protein
VSVQDAAKAFVLTQDGLQGLIDILKNAGHIVIGPRVVGSAVVVDEIQRISDLPGAWRDEQAGGHYRLRKAATVEMFGFAATA